MLHSLHSKLSTIGGHYQSCVIKNIEILLSVILVSRTVNLNLLKDDLPTVIGKKLKPESCYKKLLRCVEICSCSRLWVDLLQWSLTYVWSKTGTLCIDATEWYFGEYPIHILVLSIDFQGVAIPIFFKIYKHKGVLREEERINFMKKALRYYDLKDKELLGDREFIGSKWFCFLEKSGIKFVIRLKKKQYKEQIDSSNLTKTGSYYDKLINKALKKGYAQVIIKINDVSFRIEFWRNKHIEESKTDPVIILITNILHKKRVGKKYAQRWKIEYCFKHLKSNGFNIESIGFKKIHKLQFLIAVVIAIYILAICKGTIVDKKNNSKSKWKIYKSGVVARAVSIFRIGLFELKATAFNLILFRDFLANLKVPKINVFKFVQ